MKFIARFANQILKILVKVFINIFKPIDYKYLQTNSNILKKIMILEVNAKKVVKYNGNNSWYPLHYVNVIKKPSLNEIINCPKCTITIHGSNFDEHMKNCDYIPCFACSLFFPGFVIRDHKR